VELKVAKKGKQVIVWFESPDRCVHRRRFLERLFLERQVRVEIDLRGFNRFVSQHRAITERSTPASFSPGYLQHIPANLRASMGATPAGQGGNGVSFASTTTRFLIRRLTCNTSPGRPARGSALTGGSIAALWPARCLVPEVIAEMDRMGPTRLLTYPA
jgi:hypothetical protein